MENGATRSSVDVRELGERAGEIVHEVQESGEELVVTVDGEPVATLRRLAPPAAPGDPAQRKRALAQAMDVAAAIGRTTPPRKESIAETLSRLRDERDRAIAGIDEDGRRRR
jgi:antitoxin (DNA-binding transcriptional repressor) of toxin-antitoxin stability system